MNPELKTTNGAATEVDRRERTPGPDRRLDRLDRRAGLERRHESADAAGYTGPDRRETDERRGSGLERRRGPGRRLADDRKSAEEGEMNPYQFEFVMAIQTYKKINKRLYPTWTEILEIVEQLGYRKVEKRNFKLHDCPEPKLHKPDQATRRSCRFSGELREQFWTN